MKTIIHPLSILGALVSFVANQGLSQASSFDPGMVWKNFYSDYREIQNSIDNQIMDLNLTIVPENYETSIDKMEDIPFVHFEIEEEFPNEILPQLVKVKKQVQERVFISPMLIDDYKISSRYGKRNHPIRKKKEFHEGIDLCANTGKSVHASGNGTIRKIGKSRSYGNYVIIQHDGNYETLYAHLSRILVDYNEIVEQGQVIGKVGSTGSSTGPHLHFEIIENDESINPEKLILF